MVLVVVGIGGGGRVVRIASGVGVDMASSCVSAPSVVGCCRVRVVVSVMVLLLRVVSSVVVGLLLVVSRCLMVSRLMVPSSSSGGSIVVLLLLVVRSADSSPGRLPVRKSCIDQMVHRLEQVLDSMARGNSRVAEVRDELCGNVVDRDVGHGFPAFGRGQGTRHLVLEEPRERGGHGPVALRVGDALVLLFFSFWFFKVVEKKKGKKAVEFFCSVFVRTSALKEKNLSHLEQLGHLQEAGVVVVPVALVPSVRFSFPVSSVSGLSSMPLGLFLQVQRLFSFEEMPRLVAFALGRGQGQRQRVRPRPQSLDLGCGGRDGPVRVVGCAVRVRRGGLCLGEPAVPLCRGRPRCRQIPAGFLELVLQGTDLLRRAFARGLSVPVLVLQLGDIVVELLRQGIARTGLAEVRRGSQAEQDEQEDRERGAVPGEEAGERVSLPVFGCW